MSSKKLNLGSMDMGLGSVPTAQPSSSPAEQERRNRQLEDFVKTGSVAKETEKGIMRSYRIPEALIKEMETERFNSTMKGNRITLSDIIIDALQARYNNK